MICLEQLWDLNRDNLTKLPQNFPLWNQKEVFKIIFKCYKKQWPHFKTEKSHKLYHKLKNNFSTWISQNKNWHLKANNCEKYKIEDSASRNCKNGTDLEFNEMWWSTNIAVLKNVHRLWKYIWYSFLYRIYCVLYRRILELIGQFTKEN